MTAGAGLTGKDLYPRFSDEEYARRYRAVRNAMQKENLDAILISGARGSSEVHLSFKLFGPVPVLAFVSPGRRSDRLHSFLQPSTLRQGAIYCRRRPLVWPRPDRKYRKRNPTERAGRKQNRHREPQKHRSRSFYGAATGTSQSRIRGIRPGVQSNKKSQK